MIGSASESLPARLRALGNDELLSQVQLLVRRECVATIQILHHLNEIGRRRLFLDLGYSSLFDYCIRKLKYSPSAAGRRIQAARCIRRYPEVLELLRARELSLGTVALIAPILTDENHASVLARVRGRSYREIERVVAEYKPPVAFRDRVRPVRVAVSEPKPPAVAVSARVRDSMPAASPDPAPGSAADLHSLADDAVAPTTCRPITPGAGSVTTETKLLLQFLVSEACMAKLNEARALLSHRCPGGSFGDVLDAVLSDYINRHSPAARKQRREARTATVIDSKETTTSGDVVVAASNHSRRRECTRYIAADVRDEVFARDRNRCTYVARDGTRCGSTYALQVDHVRPYAIGGTNDPANLRLLCAAHNRHAGERTLGAQVMQRFWPRE